MNLQGRTALITGAGRRIGRYLAECMGQAQANVVLHVSRSKDEAEEAAATVRSSGSQAWVVQADFQQPEQTAEVFERIRDFTSVDILINSAAIFDPLTVQTTSLSDWQRHMNINLTAPFLLSQAFARQLPAGKKGHIVNILDWRALRPGPDHFPYTISKAGLAALTKSLAASLAPQINVNGVALGAVLPPSDGGDSQGILTQVPAGRWAKLEEVWQAVEFLVTRADYITGEIVHIDGGRHLI